MKKDLLSAVIVVAIIFGICFFIHTIRPAVPPLPSQSIAAKIASEPPKNERVVMRVNGEPVTESEFAVFLASLPAEQKQFYTTPEGKMKLAEQIAAIKSLAQEGERLGLANDKNLRAELSLANAQVVAVATLRKLAEPDPARLKAEYEKNKSHFGTMTLSHIVVAYQGGAIPPKGGGQPLALPQAMQKAQQIEQRVRRGADFAQVARAESDDTNTGAAGGQIPGDVPVSQLPPEVAALKDGEISGPVRTQIGVHVFKAGKHQSESFDAVREELAQQVRKENGDRVLEKIRRDAKVMLDQKFFPRTQLDPVKPVS